MSITAAVTTVAFSLLLLGYVIFTTWAKKR
jgi:cbb3-type cytochrome oxidase subunit 3